MKYRSLLIVSSSICAALWCIGLANAGVMPQLGKKVADFSLQDFRGKAHALSDMKEAKFVVVAFLGAECPLSKLYAPRMVELAKQYESKGVAFLGVDSNRQDSVTAMAHFAKTHQVEFPLLKDLNNTLADALGATRNPEVFVLDGDRAVRYVGRIDDQYGFQTGSGYARPQSTTRDLAAALDELLAGKAVSQPTTEAIGCLIGRVRVADAASEVTYSKQIARIFQDHCVECHRPGQIGPFALENYEQAAGWAEMIEEVVRDQRMPPWHPDPKYGHFANDLSLPEPEKELIFKWVAAGAPQGNPKDLPEPKQYAGSWMMPGGPDAVFKMTEEAVDVPAEGTVDYRYYVVDTGFKEDKWVKVAECLPDNRGVVHHMIVFLKPPGTGLFGDGGRSNGGQGAAGKPEAGDKEQVADKQEAEKPAAEQQRDRGARGRRRGGGGQASFGQLCGFAPGTRPYVLPEGMAKLIPAGWQLVFQMHYTPNGSPQKDRSSVGIKFEDPAKVKYRVATANAANPFFLIPPGAPAYEVESQRTYGREVLMLSVFPHMHLRGKDFHYELLYPDGTKETIMNMPRYDFNWQTSYVFSEPKKLPKGTTLHCTAHFDNSAENPANPDPTKPVRWGDQTWEEMMIGWFDIAVPKDTDIKEVLPPDARFREGQSGQGGNAE
ncbi:MAG TPA: redoxin domain-containing protein [Pirellulales bacterium]|nr:redoxin domain-containing protein [Pirellulales bacterium]